MLNLTEEQIKKKKLYYYKKKKETKEFNEIFYIKKIVLLDMSQQCYILRYLYVALAT